MEIEEKARAVIENALQDFDEIGLIGAVICYEKTKSNIIFQHSIHKDIFIDMMKELIKSLEAEEE